MSPDAPQAYEACSPMPQHGVNPSFGEHRVSDCLCREKLQYKVPRACQNVSDLESLTGQPPLSQPYLDPISTNPAVPNPRHDISLGIPGTSTGIAFGILAGSGTGIQAFGIPGFSTVPGGSEARGGRAGGMKGGMPCVPTTLSRGLATCASIHPTPSIYESMISETMYAA